MISKKQFKAKALKHDHSQLDFKSYGSMAQQYYKDENFGPKIKQG